MSNRASSRRRRLRKVAVEEAVAVAMVLLVYVDWWDGSVPPLPADAALLLSLGGGLLAGLVLS